MRWKAALFVMAFCSLSTGVVRSQMADYLSGCWHKQVAALGSNCLHLTYTETRRQLYHSAKPWQTMTRSASGSVWFEAGTFEKSDTSHVPNTNVSFTNYVFDSAALLVEVNDDTTLIPTTNSNWFDMMFESAMYSPVILLEYFHLHRTESSERMDSGLAVYTLTINKTLVTLAIRLSDSLLESVGTLQSDELYGDVNNIYRYASYRTVGGLSIPDTIVTEKVDGKVPGGVRIGSAEIVDKAPVLIEKPADFKFAEEKKEQPDVRIHKFSDHIYLIDLIHTGCRSMVVDFSDFLLVVDAPLSSDNGELIIEKARSIAPMKHIRYFAFGHHHPAFIGGIRPFIYCGATILTRAEDTPYVNFLASAPHALDPDSLYVHPRPKHTQILGDSLTISDGSYRMKIYYIGEKSRHTSDYVIFYFPDENVLWDDDLAWVSEKSPITKAIERQAGLVNAIEALGLHPKTIIQSWPLVGYGIKTIIPFADLEESLKAQLPGEAH